MAKKLAKRQIEMDRQTAKAPPRPIRKAPAVKTPKPSIYVLVEGTSTTRSLSSYINSAEASTKQFEASKAAHLVVKARAGTGKTFTLVLGVAYIFKGLVWKAVAAALGFAPKPSEQQAAVWDLMAAGEKPKSILYAAFNNSIVTEFSEKYKWLTAALAGLGITFSFSTIHSLGFGACKNAYKCKLNKWKVSNLLEEILGKDVREVMRTPGGEILVKSTQRLVELCKLTLTEPTADNLEGLAIRYQVECNGQKEKVFSYVPTLLEKCRQLTTEVDFADMVWLPVVNELPVAQVDLLLVDEAQDLNKCQQSLAPKAGRRLIFCGDDRQAIYGFAGADCDSLPNLTKRLEESGAKVDSVPLTVTRRCGKMIVEAARAIVGDFEAHEGNPAGEIVQATLEQVQPSLAKGDMVLCRVNAPLVGLAFRLIKEGRKANIQGRDIGEGLSALIRKLKPEGVVDLLDKLDNWHRMEVERCQRRRNVDEEALIVLEDKHACLVALCEGAVEVSDIHANIAKVFEDGAREGVLLSSVHRAKGMEAKRVLILHPEKMPHPMAKTAEAQAQEQNLKYVAITRAIETLTWVVG